MNGLSSCWRIYYKRNMHLSLQFCIRGFRKSYSLTTVRRQLPSIPCSHLCQYTKTKLSAVALSQAALGKPNDHTANLEGAELVLLKNLLTSNKQDCIKKVLLNNSFPKSPLLKTTHLNYQSSHKYKQVLLVWENILLSPRCIPTKDRRLQSNRNETSEASLITTIKPEMWYYNAIHTDDNNHPKNYSKHIEIKYDSVKSTVYMERQNNKFDEKRRTTSSGPSPEQLSLVLLRLREELPHFFDGHHRYSIYSEDLLFVNKLTRTTTRSLKAYKFIINAMQYAGKLFWSKVSFEVVRITKHSEDNTIKLRWTAKGIPWYQLPFFVLAGKPQSSLFYRYVDGFSIFEVGRDGLVHCHRLDKVIPTSTPERQKWSIRMQILTLLGLTEIESRGAYEAFQAKNQDMLKKV